MADNITADHVFPPDMLNTLLWFSYVCGCFPADKPRAELPSLEKIRSRCMQQLEMLRPDHIRRLNPTPYKVCFTSAP
jgi:hypothetical protein